MNKKISVLFVDDEENNLISFNAYFRREFEVYTASSAHSAMKIIEKIPICIIMADQKMPEITGIEFLEKTIERYPDSIRVLITGQSDVNVVIDAINRGQISRYLTKPWDWAVLQQTIYSCGEMYRVRQNLLAKDSTASKQNEEVRKMMNTICNDISAPMQTLRKFIGGSKYTGRETLTPIEKECFSDPFLSLEWYFKNLKDYFQVTFDDIPKSQVKLSEILDDLINLAFIRESGLTFAIDCQALEPIFSDPGRIRILIVQLITAAIFRACPTAKGSFCRLKAVIDGNHLVLKFQDNGEKFIPEIKDPLMKIFLHSNHAKRLPGTESGRYVVNDILSNLDAAIVIKKGSQRDVVNEFDVLIPLD